MGCYKMIILKRKRLLFIVAMVFVSVVTYTVASSKNNNVVQTVSLPVTNKVIVLDAGHGVPDGGDEMLKLRE